MITLYKGDIFEAPVDIIIHQANCFNTMGSGIARQIKSRYPQAYAADCETKKGDHNKLGKFTFAKVNNNPEKWIINIYGQYDYGRDKKLYTNYIAIAQGLRNVLYWLNKQKIKNKTIGIPYKMSCGAGGGDWEIIEGLIKTVFENSKFNVLICKI